MENNEVKTLEEIELCIALLDGTAYLSRLIAMRLRAMQAAEDFKNEPIE